MKGALRWLAAWCGSLLLAGAAAGRPPASFAVWPPPAASPPAVADDREMQALLSRLSELSAAVGRGAQSPDVWRYQVAQGEVMLRIAARCQGKERDDWLRMAVESHYSAAVQAPEQEAAPRQRLQQLPEQISRAYPGSPVVSYAAWQEVQADHLRVLGKAGDDPARAEGLLRDRLLRFAQERPNAPEAPKALLEAGRLSESLKKPEDACRCYLHLAQRYAGTPLGRRAEGMLWRLSAGVEPLRLELPLLYSTGERAGQPFDLAELRGRLVVVYFWSSASKQAEADFEALRRLTDRYSFQGLEVVYVNLDDDPVKARAFLAGRLTAGTHVFQCGGLGSPVAERLGIKALPEVFLLGRDGKLVRHSLQAAQVEAVVSEQLPRVAGRARR
jgi:hypothetical protein